MSAFTQSLAQDFLKRHPLQAALVLEGLEPGDAKAALLALEAPQRVEVMRRMGSTMAAAALAELDDSDARRTLEQTDALRIARWLALLPADGRQRLEALLPTERAQEVAELLDYPPGSAGRLMDAAVAVFASASRIDAVIEGMRHVTQRRVADLMVCDDEGRFSGLVPVQDLLSAPRDAQLASLVQADAPVVQPMTPREDVVDLLERYRLQTLPVVDMDQQLLGAIRYDGLVRAAQQAAAGDLSKMVGAGSEERALSSPLTTVRNRLPWLLINLLTAFAAAAVVGLFDATIAQFTALAVLLPVVAGQSGNTGAQALAVTSRGLALREIRARQWLRVVRKEVAAAAVNGIAVAAVTAAGVYIWSASPGLCAVIGISMVVSMVLAALSGAVIPILLTALGRDPATASSIVLTTVTDIAGFFSFLGLATALQHWLV